MIGKLWKGTEGWGVSIVLYGREVGQLPTLLIRLLLTAGLTVAMFFYLPLKILRMYW